MWCLTTSIKWFRGRVSPKVVSRKNPHQIKANVSRARVNVDGVYSGKCSNVLLFRITRLRLSHERIENLLYMCCQLSYPTWVIYLYYLFCLVKNYFHKDKTSLRWMRKQLDAIDFFIGQANRNWIISTIIWIRLHC